MIIKLIIIDDRLTDRGIADSVVDHSIHWHRHRVLGQHLDIDNDHDQLIQNNDLLFILISPLVVELPGWLSSDLPFDKIQCRARQRIFLKKFFFRIFGWEEVWSLEWKYYL